MKRRSFIKKTGLSIGGAMVVPGLLANGMLPALVNSYYLPLREGEGQIRHGMLQLPQAGYKNSLITFDWLDDVTLNSFHQKGFKASKSDEHKMISILLRDPNSDEVDAVQVLEEAKEVVILRENSSQRIQTKQGKFHSLDAKKLKNIKMEIGHLGGFKAHKRKVASNIQVYIQLLSGKMIVNDITLEPGVGLCLSSMSSLNIVPTQESKFILLYHHS